jgi:hypothetical protein
MSKIPVHQWTHDGKEVLLVKCVGVDGKSYGGFQWPQSGIVETPASRQPDCISGGLFGWPWGVNLGGGKDPDYGGKWIVFSAPPENVIFIDNEKAKVAPKEGETIARARVLFYGSWFKALRYCALGRVAWIRHNANSSAASSGDSSSAASSGDRSSVASSGYRSSAASSGYSSSAASSGDRSSAASSGDRSSAASSSYRSSAASSGDRSSAASSGDRSSAASSGDRSSAASSGDRSPSVSAGNYSAASSKICAYAGLYGRVRGKIGGALVLAFETKDKKIVAKAAIIDGKKIKPGVWYSLNEQGRFVVSKDQSKIFGEKDEEQKP